MFQTIKALIKMSIHLKHVIDLKCHKNKYYSEALSSFCVS